MLVVRSPLRIGLAGGGSDLPEFFNDEAGAVLGLTFQKYVYVALLPLDSIASESIRFTYRHTESVASAVEIRHPVVREVLCSLDPEPRINIATMADLPGGTGLGSSSAFTVALLASLDAHYGQDRSPSQLAAHAIHVERELLGEAGGWQDQLQTTFGGLRLYEFETRGFSVSEPLNPTWLPDLSKHLVLVHLGKVPRRSSLHQSRLAASIREGGSRRYLSSAAALARAAYSQLATSERVSEAVEVIAEVVREGWQHKLASSRDALEPSMEFISEGIRRGASAGKVLGAGGGGFALFVLEDLDLAEFIAGWPELHSTSVMPTSAGVEVLLHQTEGDGCAWDGPAMAGRR